MHGTVTQGMAPAKDLVSCTMISQPPRLSQMAASVHDFLAQTYPEKELVIVVDDEAYAREVNEFVKGLSAHIYVVELASRHTLGALRNVAVQQSHGQWICQWDDDDRYSPERLALQSAAALAAGAASCFLHEQLHFFEDTREMFWTDWRLFHGEPTVGPPEFCIPGTVFFQRGIACYPERGALSARGEDTVLAAELWQGCATAIESPPGTYLRTYTGQNTWHRQHHQALALARSHSAQTILRRRSELEQCLSAFGLQAPICFRSQHGIVFTY